jgi:hypothetical protein
MGRMPFDLKSIHKQEWSPMVITGVHELLKEKNMIGFFWLSEKLHVCFVGCSVAFAVIASDASCNKILP